MTSCSLVSIRGWPFLRILAPAAAGLALLITNHPGRASPLSQLLLSTIHYSLITNHPGRASAVTVANTNDNGPGSLRQALLDANDGDTIQFDQTLDGATIALSTGELVIDKNVTINGPGPNQLTISSALTSRIFRLTPGHTATITSLVISAGYGDNGGGGVFNDHATLTIDNCTIQGNAAPQDQNGKGGGIYNDGSGGSATLTVRNSTVVTNRTGLAGGGIYNSDGATLNLTNTTVSGNQAFGQISDTVPSQGGGIANDGTLIVTSSSINDNFAGADGPPVPSGTGGGISSTGTLTITDSSINGNVVGLGGGGIFVQGTATITNTTLTSNEVYGTGNDVIFGDGGAIQIMSGTVTISNSIFSGNTAGQTAGAIANAGIVDRPG
jgi:hypothetical protein